MDPNQTLREIRALVREINEDDSADNDREALLAELIGELDQWISKGGALPRPWQRK